MSKIFNFQFSILNKIDFILRKPKVIIVTGNGRLCTKEAIFQVLKEYFKIDKEVLIFETELKNSIDIKKVNFLIKNSSLPILVITHFGDIPPDKDFFAGEKEETGEIRKLAKSMPSFGYLVLNFDDETVREIKDETNLKEITFGFQERADFYASDIKINGGTNFKINYIGNVVPVWLDKVFGKEQIYSALSAAAVGTIFDLNLVEISQALKNYRSLPGKMRLIQGIKNSAILDDSESATVFSMIEAIEILGKIPNYQRKIAVLGDVLGIGKYTIEAHEAIGERVAKNADLLFTIGQRAKFIAEGAKMKGMDIEKIFQFDNIKEGLLKLKNEIKEKDLILIDGSKDIKMYEIIKELGELNVNV